MNSLFFLIPLSIFLLALAVVFLRWAIRSGQYEDLDKEGHSILFEDDEDMLPPESSQTRPDETRDSQKKPSAKP